MQIRDSGELWRNGRAPALEARGPGFDLHWVQFYNVSLARFGGYIYNSPSSRGDRCAYTMPQNID